MTYTELFFAIHWAEWLFYIPAMFVLFIVIFNKDISYAIGVNENYGSPFFSSLWYALCLPDDYISCTNYNTKEIRGLEIHLNGVLSGSVLVEYEDERILLREKSKTKKYPIRIYISNGKVYIDGSHICLPPKELIQILHLWSERKTKAPVKKKTLLT